MNSGDIYCPSWCVIVWHGHGWCCWYSTLLLGMAECMSFYFMTGACLTDVVFVIPWSQDVCGCVLSLLDVWLIFYLSFLTLSLYVVVFCPCWMSCWSSASHSLLSVCMWLCFCPCWMSGWSSASHSLLSGCMWLCSVPAGCLADLLPLIPCSQDVCGCVLSLLDVWLILCLLFLALSMYVVLLCPCWMSGWSSAWHSLLSDCMWFSFVPAGCLTDLLVIPCSQHVCGCFLFLLDVWLILCFPFLALRMYVVVFCPCWMSG